MKYPLCLLFALILFSKSIYSQTSPSLTAGINEVVYTKGKLDAELIAQIIATKRGEIKSELAQRLILKNFRCGSFTVYNYVNNSVNLLLSETNKEVISKGLLENSAELLIVYGFAEFYLMELRSRAEALQPYEQRFLEEMGWWTTKPNKELITKAFGIGFPDSSNTELEQKNKKENAFKITNGSRITTALPSIGLLNLFSNSSEEYSESDRVCDNVATSHILVDMIFEILKKNEQVKEMGFFRDVDGKLNKEFNKYLNARNTSLYHPDIYNNISGKDGRDSLVWQALSNRIDRVFSFYRTLSTLHEEISEEDHLTKKKLVDHIEGELTTFSRKGTNPGSDALNRFNTLINAADDDFVKIAVPTNKAEILNLDETDKQLLKTLKKTIDQLKLTDYNNSVKQLEFFRLRIESQLLPELLRLNIESYGAYKDLIEELKAIAEHIRLRGLLGVLAKIAPDNASTSPPDTVILNENVNFFTHFKNYVRIVDIINNLDQADSYDKIFNFITSIDETFGNTETKHVLTTITEVYDKYVTLDRTENKLSLDVESVAVDIYTRYGENTNAAFSMYFSVGINTSADFKHDNITIGDNVAQSKFSYVSEKIGLKFIPRFLNFNRRYSLGFIKRQPILSSIHALTYASGLLYQIEALNSNDNFKSPMYGFGIGLTFFNGLDLNLSYSKLFEKNSYNLWNIGFDIRVTEYLGALKKKKSLVNN